MAAILLAWARPAPAQTDSLVVDQFGRVGVGTALIGPNEAVQVTAALKSFFVKVPRRCGQGPVPVRIRFSDATTGVELLTEQSMLTAETRAFRATLDPLGDTTAVEVAILTQKRLRLCVTWNSTPAGPAGFRTLAP